MWLSDEFLASLLSGVVAWGLGWCFAFVVFCQINRILALTGARGGVRVLDGSTVPSNASYKWCPDSQNQAHPGQGLPQLYRTGSKVHQSS